MELGKTGGALVVVGSFTADGNLRKPTAHVTFFSFTAHDVSQFHFLCESSHVSCALVIVCSLFRSSLCTLLLSLPSSFLLPEPELLHFPFPVDVGRARSPVHFVQ